MEDHKTLVTGGAGFIGSHLVERLLEEGQEVTVIDNFSSGTRENIQHLLDNPNLTIIKEDLKKPKQLSKAAEESNLIYHLAANPEVRIGETDPSIHFQENILATFNLLQTLRSSKTPKTIIFTSTSTIYGEAKTIPTPETYGPTLPISTYGASKLAAEALITSNAHTFNNRALILRLANIIGPRSNHGVIADFVKKIAANPKQLEILGDGTQDKSYLYIEDLINATIHLTNTFQRENKQIDAYNVGATDKITVKEIAQIVSQEMHQPNIPHKLTGGIDGGRGWKGDVKNMQLSIEKLRQTGWKPKYTSRTAVTLATREMAKKHLQKSPRKEQLHKKRPHPA